MPTRLRTKPCRRCGEPVAGIKRPERHAYHYPKVCERCRPLARATGERNGSWRGGRRMTPNGYVEVRGGDPGRRRYVYEHRKVWEDANGPIPKGCDVHHINHIRDDNRLENLVLLGRRDHNRHHFKITRWAKDFDRCIECGTDEVPHEGHGLCRRCHCRKRWAKGRATGAHWAHRSKRVSDWSLYHERCADCGTTEHPHAAHGRCFPCDYRWRKAVGLR